MAKTQMETTTSEAQDVLARLIFLVRQAEYVAIETTEDGIKLVLGGDEYGTGDAHEGKTIARAVHAALVAVNERADATAAESANLLRRRPAAKRKEPVYECEECSINPGSPTLCERCVAARSAAWDRWSGPRPTEDRVLATTPATLRALSKHLSERHAAPSLIGYELAPGIEAAADLLEHRPGERVHADIDPGTMLELRALPQIELLELARKVAREQ